MLLDVMKYSFINAKIRAMKSRLLKESVYQQLLETTQLDAFVKVLMDTEYSPEISVIDTKNPDISEVISALDEHLIKCYKTILQFFKVKTENDFIRMILSRLEIENLKIIIRGKFKGITSIMISDNVIPTHGVSNLNFEELINSRDVEHFVSLLAKTRYERPLKEALPFFERDRRTAILERPLDSLYYIDLIRAIKTLSKSDGYIMKAYIGTFCDINNVMLILRSRIFFALPSDETMAMYIPYGYRLTKSEAVQLSKTTEDDYREVLGKTHYGKRVTNFKSLTDLEMGLLNILTYQTKKILMGYPFHIGTVAGFLAVKEIEAGNLKSIAEGKRHTLSEGEIRESLLV
jgi:V/A-type H+/Na+-transporting ATPase subunit C